MKRIVILGGGTGGTIMANRLHRLMQRDAPGDVRITVVDQDDQHVYQPGLLFVPFGIYAPEEIVKPRGAQLDPEVEYIQAPIDRVESGTNQVRLENGTTLPYDVLVIATGTQINPGETEGMLGPGWRETVFDFYTLDGATALGEKLRRWEGGRLVVNIVDVPIKCPVAGLEFSFLADWYLAERGIRDRSTITFVTPLDGAFTKPVASAELAHLLADKRIELVTEFNTGSVDGAAGVLTSWDDRTVPFDLLVTIPLHTGAPFIAMTPGLGDDLNYVKVDPHTLQSELAPNIFAIGDATNVPASKAGSVAHFESEVLDRNILRFLQGEPLLAEFDGHANCFIESGYHKAMLIDFNYEVEPLPGRFPLPRFGPLSLLEESRLNHLGKLAFRHIYWNMLLPGRHLPGIGARMSMRGKHRLPTHDKDAGSRPAATTAA